MSRDGSIDSIPRVLRMSRRILRCFVAVSLLYDIPEMLIWHPQVLSAR